MVTVERWANILLFKIYDFAVKVVVERYVVVILILWHTTRYWYWNFWYCIVIWWYGMLIWCKCCLLCYLCFSILWKHQYSALHRHNISSKVVGQRYRAIWFWPYHPGLMYSILGKLNILSHIKKWLMIWGGFLLPSAFARGHPHLHPLRKLNKSPW